jgi:DNA-binding transcriptional regulator YiaG
MQSDAARKAGGPPPHAGRIIRSWRRRIGLTQEGLAQALSVTFSTVSRWENEHVKPSKLAWRALEQLATERNCPLGALGTDDEGNGDGE